MRLAWSQQRDMNLANGASALTHARTGARKQPYLDDQYRKVKGVYQQFRIVTDRLRRQRPLHHDASADEAFAYARKFPDDQQNTKQEITKMQLVCLLCDLAWSQPNVVNVVNKSGFAGEEEPETLQSASDDPKLLRLFANSA